MFTIFMLGIIFVMILVGIGMYGIFEFCLVVYSYYKDTKKKKEENKKKEQYYEDIRNGKIYIINR